MRSINARVKHRNHNAVAGKWRGIRADGFHAPSHALVGVLHFLFVSSAVGGDQLHTHYRRDRRHILVATSLCQLFLLEIIDLD